MSDAEVYIKLLACCKPARAANRSQYLSEFLETNLAKYKIPGTLDLLYSNMFRPWPETAITGTGIYARNYD